MKIIRNWILGIAGALAVALGGFYALPVVAQSAGQTLTYLISTDLVQVYRAGTAAITYATPWQISNAAGYVKAAALTGFSYTFGNSQTELLLRPAGTLNAGYVTLAATPSDGARNCIFSTQIVTFLYVSASGSQSINNAATTIAANGKLCYTYSLANTTWDRSQ